jgi:hypothetical protein
MEWLANDTVRKLAGMFPELDTAIIEERVVLYVIVEFPTTSCLFSFLLLFAKQFIHIRICEISSLSRGGMSIEALVEELLTVQVIHDEESIGQLHKVTSPTTVTSSSPTPMSHPNDGKVSQNPPAIVIEDSSESGS